MTSGNRKRDEITAVTNPSCIRSESEALPSGDSGLRHGLKRPWRLIRAGYLLLAVMTPAAATASDGKSADGTNETNSGLREMVFKPNARLCYDLAFYNENKNRLTNGTLLRFGRVGGRLQIQPSLTAALDVNFNSGKPAVDEAWGEYRGRELTLKGGYFKEPLGLEVLSSVLHLAFMERSLPFALSPFRKTGVTVARARSLYSLSIGVFNGNLVHGDGEQGFAVTGRATFAPRLNEQTRLHLGVGVSRRTADADTSGARSLSFSSTPETRVDDSKFLNTGTIHNADYSLTSEFEAAISWRLVRLYGEYWTTDVKRSAGLAEPSFEGGYVAADIVLLGRQRPYLESGGVFGGVVPSGGGNALELAFRYSWLDLNDAGARITGGKGREYTLAVNWHFNRYVRWMTNYGIVRNDAAADGAGTLYADDDYAFVQCRLQMSY